MNKSFWFVVPSRHLRLIECGWGNGYVAIHKSHPWFEKDYDDVPVDVHCGLTYGNSLKDALDYPSYLNAVADTLPKGHPAFKSPKDWWVFGFDTAHYDDSLSKWPKEAVEEETRRLQKQIDDAQNVSPFKQLYLWLKKQLRNLLKK